MARRRHWGILFFVGIFFYALLLAVLPAAAQTVRVGIFSCNGFSNIHSDGSIDGYEYDYLQEIALYTGWQYEYISSVHTYDAEGNISGTRPLTYEDSLAMLSQGSLDLMAPVPFSGNIASPYRCSKLALAQNVTALTTLSASISAAQPQSLEGLRIGVVRGLSDTSQLSQRMETLGVRNFTIIPIPSVPNLTRALQRSKTIDAIYAPLFRKSLDEMRVFQSDPIRYYFAVNPNRADLSAQLDQAMEQVYANHPGLEAYLSAKYYGIALTGFNQLTKAEQDYVAAHPVLRIVVGDDFEPIEYVDDAGQPAGVSIEAIRRALERSGIQCEYVVQPGLSKRVAALQDRTADVFCGMPDDFNLAAKNHIKLTDTYMEIKMMAILKQNRVIEDRDDLTIGVSTHRHMNDLARRQFSHARLVNFLDMEEGLSLVRSGQVDAILVPVPLGELLLRRPSMKEFTWQSMPHFSYRLCLGVEQEADPMLYSILNKSIHNLSTNEADALMAVALAKKQQDSVLDAVYRYPLPVVIFSCLLIGLMALALFNFRRFRKSGAALAFSEERFKFALEKSGLEILDYDIAARRLRNMRMTGDKYVFLEWDNVPESLFQQGYIHDDSREKLKKMLQDMEAGLAEGSVTLHVALMDEQGRATGEYVWKRLKYNVHSSSYGRSVLAIMEDVTESMDAAKDGLTGAYNRKIGEALIAERLQQDDCGAVLLLDIDDFKHINDTQGHIYGDRVLAGLVQAISGLIRTSDVVYRLGGDEFIIFLTGKMKMDTARQVAHKIRLLIAAQSQSDDVTCSIGIAVAPNHGNSLPELYKHADIALYQAKENGKNNCRMYNGT